jgi:hypothetical protein|tara:strand:- start:116 stop:355 length:240 start_codon:yes stop_codon:yes gene_type:complete
LEQILLNSKQQSALSGSDPAFKLKIKPRTKPNLAQSLPDRRGPDTGSEGRPCYVAGSRATATDVESIWAYTFDGFKMFF